jgi:hypothetical protein
MGLSFFVRVGHAGNLVSFAAGMTFLLYMLSDEMVVLLDGLARRLAKFAAITRKRTVTPTI